MAAEELLSPASYPALPPPREEDEEDLQALLSQCASHSPEDWTTMVEIPELQVYRHKSPSSRFPYKIRTKCLLQNSALFCFKVLTDERNWVLEHVNFGNLPRLVKQATRLEDVDPRTRIVYMYLKGYWPIADRELVFKLHERILPDGRMVAVGRSVDHHAAPPHPKALRVVGDTSGAIFSPLEDGTDRCWVELVFEGDPQGWIPDHLISLACKLAPQALWFINKLIRGPRAKKAFKLRESEGLRPQASASATASTSPPSTASSSSSTTRETSLVVASASAVAMDSLPPTIRRHAAEGKPRAKGFYGTVLEIRRALQWASPFMVFVVYFCVLYTFSKRRLREISRG